MRQIVGGTAHVSFVLKLGGTAPGQWPVHMARSRGFHPDNMNVSDRQSGSQAGGWGGARTIVVSHERRSTIRTVR